MSWGSRFGLILATLMVAGLLQSCGKSESDKTKTAEQPSSQVIRKATSNTANTQAGKTSPETPSPQAHKPASTPSNAVGRIVLVRGTVYIHRHQSGKRQTARTGLPIYLDDHIITTERGYARMRLRDDSILRIAPTSNLAVTTQLIGGGHKNTTIDLLKGKLRALVVHKLKPGDSFEVKTKVAVAGVRGTDFEVIADQGTVVRCYTGVVAIHNLDSKVTGHVLLTPNTYTYIGREKPPIKPKRLPAYIKPMQDPPPLPATPQAMPPRANIESPGVAVKPLAPVGAQTQAEAPQPQATNTAPESAKPPMREPEPPAPPAKPQPITQAVTNTLMDKGFQISIKNLRHSNVQTLWEQNTDKPLHDMLYGDGLDGWMLNPAK